MGALRTCMPADHINVARDVRMQGQDGSCAFNHCMDVQRIPDGLSMNAFVAACVRQMGCAVEMALVRSQGVRQGMPCLYKFVHSSLI